MIFNQTEKQEKEYLQQAITIINGTVNTTSTSVKEHIDTLQKYKGYLWLNKDIDPHKVRSMHESILSHFTVGENVIDKHRRLSKILDIPYFGQIDFQEKKDKSLINPIYIGIRTSYDFKEKRNLIYDWRAPIPGIFYDYELDKATYPSPAGEIDGTILSRRQYRIRKGSMEYMTKSSVAVHNDILQKELCSNADNKMRNIVTTTQREQNRTVRNENTTVLIIQGVAGSGKISIVLHHIAYLLYAQKRQISSKDILIILPSKVFTDYISGVLPELGEETVPEISTEQVLSGVPGNKYKCQTFSEQVTELLEKPTQDFIKRTQYKATFKFMSQLDKFILCIENNYFKAIDIKLTKYIAIPAEFISEQSKRFYRYPVHRRFETMADYILEMMKFQYSQTVSAPEKNQLERKIKNMFTGNNGFQIYKNFFEWVRKPGLFKIRKSRLLEYVDLTPLAYLHITLNGDNVQFYVRHLLIDEMQDCSPIQYKVIQKLYPCRETIPGDASQSVNPCDSSATDTIQKVFTTGEIMELCKSYRSTFEITSFTQKTRPNSELEPTMRRGEHPRILQFRNTEGEIRSLADLVSSFKSSYYASLGVICKAEPQTKKLAQKLQPYTDCILPLSNQGSIYIKGIIVASAHTAKGLEFDEVIIPQADDEDYHSSTDKSVLYITVAKATHQLILTYSGPLRICRFL